MTAKTTKLPEKLTDYFSKEENVEGFKKGLEDLLLKLRDYLTKIDKVNDFNAALDIVENIINIIDVYDDCPRELLSIILLTNILPIPPYVKYILELVLKFEPGAVEEIKEVIKIMKKTETKSKEENLTSYEKLTTVISIVSASLGKETEEFKNKIGNYVLNISKAVNKFIKRAK